MTTELSLARVGSYTAYAAVAVTVVALPVLAGSGSECRFVGSATQDYAGAVSEPGHTVGLIAFTIAPLLAVGALVLIAQGRREGRRALRFAVLAAALVFPLALADFFLWAVKGAFGCPGFF